MPFREKVKRVFGRQSPPKRESIGGRINRHGIRVEYYRRGACPPSKFRGPFDREHQKRLAAWNFEDAMAEGCRSPDLSLSPCTTVPQPVTRTQEELDEHIDPLDKSAAPVGMLGHSSRYCIILMLMKTNCSST